MYSVDPDIESNGSVHNLLCFESYSLEREREKERDIVLIRWLSLTSCSGLCVLFYFKHCFFFLFLFVNSKSMYLIFNCFFCCCYCYYCWFEEIQHFVSWYEHWISSCAARVYAIFACVFDQLFVEYHCQIFVPVSELYHPLLRIQISNITKAIDSQT